jgi:hypothetical protein
MAGGKAINNYGVAYNKVWALSCGSNDAINAAISFCASASLFCCPWLLLLFCPCLLLVLLLLFNEFCCYINTFNC